MAVISRRKLETALPHRTQATGLLGAGVRLAAVRAVNLGAGIALTVLLAGALGADGYGQYLFALALAQILAMPVLAGLPTLVVRETAVARATNDRATLRGLRRWAFGLVAGTSGLLGLAALGWALVAAPTGGGAGVALLAVPLVAGLGFLRVAASLLQGHEKPFAGALPDGALRPLLLLAFVALALAAGGLSPPGAMALHAGAVAGALAWTLLAMARLAPAPATAHPRYAARAWLRSLLPLSLITAAALVNARLDLLMLGVLEGSESVAVYGIAAQIAGTALIGRQIVATVLQPRLARLWAAGARDELQALATRAARLAALSVAGAALAVALAGPPAIEALVGPAFATAAPLAVFLCVGLLVVAATGPADALLNMAGHEMATVKAVAAGAALNAALNAVLIPAFATPGAAAASVVSLALAHLLLARAAATRLGIRTWAR